MPMRGGVDVRHRMAAAAFPYVGVSIGPLHKSRIYRGNRARPPMVDAVGLTPLATSQNTWRVPVARSWRTWASTLWPSVETPA